ncbi:PQQ-like beta-propeller repeat protein [Actinoplanes sp. TRM 88003]|uniref:PQQ-like beta-propeller repeat protein n=1 Tax=Paractinoplanes aksuensis TaxID=2939490 RepID=A0ABT1DUV9_9ACTN|nr:PQQ-binding-like beta-propeller repeat protein [Actinoplanes aksuensis]MCO8273831.1 PQQ-like beta-propeller repeat protein [Actinoplanes aksuensis]
MRSRFLAVAATAGLVFVSSPAAATTPDTWGQEAGHATGDYYNPGETRLTPANAARLKPRWTVPAASVKCAEPAVPLVAGQRLITAASYQIRGYDASTGARVWQTPVTGKKTSISLAAIVGKRLIAQYRDCRSNKAFLTAHDVATGKVVYQKRIPETMYDLVVDKGIVLGSVWDEPISKYGIRAYRIADGARVWARVGSIGGQRIVADGKVLVVGDDNKSTAIDVTTGRAVWKAGAGCFTPIGASPDGAAFYMRCDPDGLIRRVSSATGAVLGTFPSHGSTMGFATDGERVYLHTLASTMIAVDARDGRRVWTATFADDTPYGFAIGGGVVYGWRSDGHPLAAFEARTGRAITLDAGTSALRGAPIVANGRLYGRIGSTVTAYAP